MTSRISEGQQWLIGPMQKIFGLRSNKEGVCHGASHMALYPILLKETYIFNERLHLIHDTPPAELTALPSAIDIRAFFEGIEIYQNERLYLPLFGEHKTALKSAIVMPIKLNNIIAVGNFSGIYDEITLTASLIKLRTKLQQKKFPCKKPVGFILENIKHAICVGYYPDDDIWVFFDINQSPITFFSAPNIFAGAILWALSSNNSFAFAGNVYVAEDYTKDQLPALKQLINDCFNLMPNKKQATHELERWLYLAANLNHSQALTALLKMPINIDKTFDHQISALYVAAANGHVNCARQLLKQGANPNIPYRSTSKSFHTIVKNLICNKKKRHLTSLHDATPLYMAAQEGHVDVVRLLLKKGARTDLTFFNVTPLQVATQEGHIDIVKILLKHRIPVNATFTGTTSIFLDLVEDNKSNKNLLHLLEQRYEGILPEYLPGISALHLAVAINNADMVKVLLDGNASTHQLLAGATVLEIAEAIDNPIVVQLIKQKMTAAIRNDNEFKHHHSCASCFFPKASRYQDRVMIDCTEEDVAEKRVRESVTL